MKAIIYSNTGKLVQQECTVRAEPRVLLLRILVDPKHDARGKKEQRAVPGFSLVSLLMPAPRLMDMS